MLSGHTLDHLDLVKPRCISVYLGLRLLVSLLCDSLQRLCVCLIRLTQQVLLELQATLGDWWSRLVGSSLQGASLVIKIKSLTIGNSLRDFVEVKFESFSVLDLFYDCFLIVRCGS